MWAGLTIGALLMGVVVYVDTAPEADLVKHVPGLKEQPKFKTYAGYLKATGTAELFYWFVESQSNPASDPLLLWLNGGPGCSTMLGFLMEHGPFTIQEDGVTVKPNPYSWNKLANIIYMDSPAGVGYSYNKEKNYTTGDWQVAQGNFAAINSFFKLYPEYKNHAFYVGGQSYGGMYVPTLTYVLLTQKNDFNFKGNLVGNGLFSYDVNDNSVMYYGYYHGLIGYTAWHQLLDECCHGDETGCDFKKGALVSEPCKSHLEDVHHKLLWSGVDKYNYLKACDFTPTTKRRSADGKTVRPMNDGGQFLEFYNQNGGENEPFTFIEPCENHTALIMYLESEEVKKALHDQCGRKKWELCTDKVLLPYDRHYPSAINFYKTALNSTKNLRLVIYGGDLDMTCNVIGSEWFVHSLGAKNMKEWRQWTVMDDLGQAQVAGYVQEFDRLTFLTVKGAGHSPPIDKPKETFQLFERFITDKPF